MVFDTGAQ